MNSVHWLHSVEPTGLELPVEFFDECSIDWTFLTFQNSPEDALCMNGEPDKELVLDSIREAHFRGAFNEHAAFTHGAH